MNQEHEQATPMMPLTPWERAHGGNPDSTAEAAVKERGAAHVNTPVIVPPTVPVVPPAPAPAPPAPAREAHPTPKDKAHR